MGLVREPDGVDFTVESRPLNNEEKKEISEIIEHYKKTGEVKNTKTTRRLPKTKKRESV